MSSTFFFKIFYLALSLTMNYRRTFKERAYPNPGPLASFDINLDLKPKERWEKFISKNFVLIFRFPYLNK